MTAVILNKRSAGIILVRLAQSDEPAAAPLYVRVMNAGGYAVITGETVMREIRGLLS